jgi:hypothetical protein
MLDTIYLTALIVAISFILLGIGILFKRKFPNTHVSGNKEMRKRGIGCVQSQDREARKENPHRIAERVKHENSNE